MSSLKQPPQQDRRALISRTAYQKYQSRGAQAGSDLQDWLEAEQEILSSPNHSDPQAATPLALTTQELEIIQLVAEGGKNKQIAECLGTCEQAVEQHLVSIFSKLGVSDRFELIICAYARNLVEFK